MGKSRYFFIGGIIMLKKDIARTITRVAKGKKGTGRKRTKADIRRSLQEYRERTAQVKADMDWEDYLNLIDIATYTNANNAVDLAFRLGYMVGKGGVGNE